MERLCIILCLFLTIALTACNSTRSTDQLLAQVWRNDQTIREQMMAVTKAVTTEGRTDLIDSLIVLSEEVNRIDAENIAIVDSILQRGLPPRLSDNSYKTIWIVIDHAALDKQEQYLPLIEQMARSGKIGLDEYATLFDRVAMKQNRAQRYGTQTVQFGSPENMHLYVWPIENPEKLDSLRVAVGMSPFTAYLQQITDAVGMEPTYDPTLSVEALNQMRGKVSQN